MKYYMQPVAIWIITIATWAMLSPEFCFTVDCIEKYDLDTKTVSEFMAEEDFEDLLNAEQEQIEIKFKFLEIFKKYNSK